MKFTYLKLKIAGHDCELDEFSTIKNETTTTERIQRGIWSLIRVSSSNKDASKLFYSSYLRYVEIERHDSSRYPYVIHPYSVFRTWWTCVMIIALFGHLTVLPYAHSFYVTGYDEDDERPHWLFYVMTLLIFNIVCCVDIVLNFFTGYYNPDTREVVLDLFPIARRYIIWWFWVDVISSIPLNYIFTAVLSPENTAYNSPVLIVGFLCSSVKLFRVWTLLSHIAYMAKIFDMHPYAHRLLHLAVIAFLLIHWTACFSYFIPFAVHTPELTNTNATLYEPTYQHSWINQYRVYHLTVRRKYLFSALGATARVSSVGPCFAFNQHTLDEVIANIVWTIMAMLFQVYLFANIFLISMSYYRAESKYFAIVSQLKRFMFHTRLQKRARQRMLTFYDYRFRGRYFQEHKIIRTISGPLRRELKVFTCRRLVERVAIFKGLPHNIISNIVMQLKHEVYLKRDVIVQADTIGNCMYFLESGTVAVLRDAGQEICHLVDGMHFGEIALINEDQKRVSTIVALETTECYRLDRVNFKRCIAVNPKFLEAVKTSAVTRQNEATMLEYLYI